MRVLLVEDDRMIGAAVCEALKDAAYAVDWVKGGDLASEAMHSEIYDIVLLDLGLPDIDGIEVLKRIRSKKERMPIIISPRAMAWTLIFTISISEPTTTFVKPFEIGELLARMRAVVRREGSGVSPLLTNGKLALNPATREATFLDEQVILSGREFALLQALLTRPGVILSRTELERHIYGWSEEVESNAVEFLIHGVRKKLGVSAIRNVRGVGWLVDRSE